MKRKSLWSKLLAVLLAAIVAAVIAYVLYYYRDSVKSALALVKKKGKKLLGSCREDFSDYADL